ncbi:hypothetical protein F5X99DRAFT_412152 [Biscogniauxia marginata]|nr:hypothetical protein F5X99DRAFT_412152 [Biscogniauxia marginata]
MNRFLTPRFKLFVHLAELGMVVAAMIIAGVRLLTREKSQPMTRTDSMALAMGAKSIIIILYQVLSEHVRSFHKWASKKANLILNSLEIVFWAAVAFMAIQSNTTRTCTGTSCFLNWAVVVLAIQVSLISVYTSWVSLIEYREFKATREKGSQYPMGTPSDSQSAEP